MRWVFLIVTATVGFRHESIEVAERVLEDVWQSPWFRTHVGGILDWAVAQQNTPSKRRSVRR